MHVLTHTNTRRRRYNDHRPLIHRIKYKRDLRRDARATTLRYRSKWGNKYTCRIYTTMSTTRFADVRNEDRVCLCIPPCSCLDPIFLPNFTLWYIIPGVWEKAEHRRDRPNTILSLDAITVFGFCLPLYRDSVVLEIQMVKKTYQIWKEIFNG